MPAISRKLSRSYLGSNLACVFDLVRCAETKNAALPIFASAWIFAMLNLLSSDRVTCGEWRRLGRSVLPSRG